MNIALILAGGTGSRLGEKLPKQYLEVGGRPVIARCLETFGRHPLIDYIQVVAEEGFRSLIAKYTDKLLGFSAPGTTRQLSVWNGMQDIMRTAGEEDVVIIHDAARPLVSERIITDCLEACREHDGVLTFLPVKDTVYYGKNGEIEGLLERDCLMAGQTPEAFLLGKYLAANAALLPEKILQINGSTEPAVMAGLNICCVRGEERNFKITTAEDLERFAQIVGREAE